MGWKQGHNPVWFRALTFGGSFGKQLSRATQKHDVYLLERHRLTPHKGRAATATNNVQLASSRRRSPGQGTGTWISEEHQMTLTYRGSSYEIGSKLPLVQPTVELHY